MLCINFRARRYATLIILAELLYAQAADPFCAQIAASVRIPGSCYSYDFHKILVLTTWSIIAYRLWCPIPFAYDSLTSLNTGTWQGTRPLSNIPHDGMQTELARHGQRRVQNSRGLPLPKLWSKPCLPRKKTVRNCPPSPRCPKS